MMLRPANILMFLLAGAGAIWGLFTLIELQSPGGFAVGGGMLAVGGTGMYLALLPLADRPDSRLRRLRRMHDEGLLSDEELAAQRDRVLQ